MKRDLVWVPVADWDHAAIEHTFAPDGFKYRVVVPLKPGTPRYVKGVVEPR